MSKSIYDVTLLELLPENFRNDPDIIAASKAVDKDFHTLANAIKKCFTIVDIDSASEEVLDHLAIEMNTDFYDQNFELEKKRELIKNAYLYHYTKGTSFVVKQLLQDAFGQGEVQEWFQYGGQPYYFKVVANAEDLADPAKVQQLVAAINSVKNERSHFEGFFQYGTHESLRAFTHEKLSTYSHQVIGSGTPLL